MALPVSEDHIVDDEIFFGELSLEEVKKHISLMDDSGGSLEIIETHSAPNLNKTDINVPPKRAISNASLSSTESVLFSGWVKKPNDDTIMMVEQMVTEISEPRSTIKKSPELDNSLEIIDHILNHGPTDTVRSKNKPLEVKKTGNSPGNFELDPVIVIPDSNSLASKECNYLKCNKDPKHIPQLLKLTKCCYNDNSGDSLEIIETHSAPNLNKTDINVPPKRAISNASLSSTESVLFSGWVKKPNDDTIMMVEQMVTEISEPRSTIKKSPELDNSLEIIDHILNHGPTDTVRSKNKPLEVKKTGNSPGNFELDPVIVIPDSNSLASKECNYLKCNKDPKHIPQLLKLTKCCYNDNSGDSLEIIETHSAPNLNKTDINVPPKRAISNASLSSTESVLFSGWVKKPNDDTIMMVEQMVTEISEPRSTIKKSPELDNSLEIIDHILNHGPTDTVRSKNKPLEVKKTGNSPGNFELDPVIVIPDSNSLASKECNYLKCNKDPKHIPQLLKLTKCCYNDNSGDSLEIIETHSAPNLNKTDINVPPKRAISNASLSSTESVLFSGWVKKPNDDTIMMVEQMVTEISEPRSTIKKSPELDNSLEIIDHILNHGPTDTVRSKNKPLEVKKTGNSPGNFELDPVIVIPDSNSLASKECNYLKCNKDPKHIPQLLKLTKCCYNDNSGDSLEIIETHSAPNLNKTDINVPPKRAISNASLSSTESVLFSGWVKKPNDDTIMMVEQMVTEISEPRSTIKKSPELDNSLEIIDHILNHGPTDTVRSKNKPLEVKKTGNSPGNFELDPVIVIPDSNSLASKECNYLKCNRDPKHIPQLLKLTKCCYNDNSGDSLEIIETHSAPNLNKTDINVPPKRAISNASLSSTESVLFSGWVKKPNDDTIMMVEQMVTEISEPRSTIKKSPELDNSLEIIDHILNHGPTDTVRSKNKPLEVKKTGNSPGNFELDPVIVIPDSNSLASKECNYLKCNKDPKHIPQLLKLTKCCYNDNSGDSLEIIETHSAPNLNKTDINVPPKRTISNASLSSTESVLFSGWVKKPNDDTIMIVEQMVTEISELPNTSKKSHELDNTLDIIDYIPNHGPTDTVQSGNKPSEVQRAGISLEEVKKHISLMDDSGGSLEIIETHSAPNLNKTDINVPPKRTISNASLSSTESVLFSGWVKKPTSKINTIM